MTLTFLFVTLAFVMQSAVVAGLLRHVRATRAARRQLDSYLRWLLGDAAGRARETAEPLIATFAGDGRAPIRLRDR